MTATLERTHETADVRTGRDAIDLATVGRFWCPAVLPNGTRGHWFSAESGIVFLCHDPACSRQGQIAHQCPVHRGVLGSASAS